MAGKRCPNQHRRCWIIGDGTALWCYECGAIRPNQPNTGWVHPSGVGGENPNGEWGTPAEAGQ